VQPPEPPRPAGARPEPTPDSETGRHRRHAAGPATPPTGPLPVDLPRGGPGAGRRRADRRRRHPEPADTDTTDTGTDTDGTGGTTGTDGTDGRAWHPRPAAPARPPAPATPTTPTRPAAPTPPATLTRPAVPTRPAGPASPAPGDDRAGARSRPRRAPTGHGHGHGPAQPAGRRVRLIITGLLVPCVLATLVGLVLLWPAAAGPAADVGEQPVAAAVTAAEAADCTPGSGEGGCVALVVRMDDGPLPGRSLVQIVPVEPGTPRFTVGDEVVLGWSGADPADPGSYRVADFQRSSPMLWLAALFAGAVLLLGRWRGLLSLVALGLTFVVLLLFVLPAILDGANPLAVAVVGSGAIMFVVLYLTHGLSVRTSVAVLGTLLSLALIGVLAAAFSAAARLTGLDDQTANLIASLGTGVDARGLLLAGVVIGALGVLDDVTVTQTSAVWEIRRADPELGAAGLFTAAMRIGRDHVSAAVNTLVLAYAGAALPLLLVFSLSGRGLGDVVTSQDIATEVVRTLVGSIGLVASVPITTALAALVASQEDPVALRG
jgi:uncharacterized membrane protein